jgi:hypothetical protein
MITQINPALFCTRLISECAIFDSRVIETIPDPDLEIHEYESPLVFVYLSDDKSEGEGVVLGRTRQIHHGTITTEVVVRKTATRQDKFNTTASNLMKQANLEIKQALIGWQPLDAIYPVTHIGGDLVIKAKTLHYLSHFDATVLISN